MNTDFNDQFDSDEEEDLIIQAGAGAAIGAALAAINYSQTYILGKKRSADEADVATREDSAKRRRTLGLGET